MLFSFNTRFWNKLLLLHCLNESVLEICDLQIEKQIQAIPELVTHFQKSQLRRDESLDGMLYFISCINIGEIGRDVIRTFHNHQLFHIAENQGQEVLDCILRGISDQYLSIGYCQGMNYVVGAMLVGIIDPELAHYCDTDCKM